MGLGDKPNVTVSFHRTGIDSPLPIYFSGETVSGKVALEVSSETKVKYLEIHAKGKAEVCWAEIRNVGDATYTEVYHSKVKLFNLKYTLLGQENDGGQAVEGHIQLSPGQYEYEFSFQLPQGVLVPTFKGKHGYISYYVKALLHRPRHLTTTAKSEYIVFQHIDTNDPSLLIPQMGSKDKTICCWCCASGPILLTVKMERKGYVPGESLPVIVEVQNSTSRDIVPKVAICQKQTFHARGAVKEESVTLSKLKGKPVTAKSFEKWNCQLNVPQYPPSILNCPILFMEYVLKVQLKIPRAANLSIDMPLIIGSIPVAPEYSSDFLMQPISSVST